MMNIKNDYGEISALSNDLLDVYRDSNKETCIYPVKDGLFALIDFEDKEKVISAGKWFAQKPKLEFIYFQIIMGREHICIALYLKKII